MFELSRLWVQPAGNDVAIRGIDIQRGRGDTAVIREDRELLAELARLNSAMASFALRIMEGSATGQEQRHYAQRLIAAGERLRRRADEMPAAVIDGEVIGEPMTLPQHTAERDGKS